MPDPYRVLFPIGLTWGLIGAGLWPLHAIAGGAWPGAAHRLLMIQGFEQSFVLGFLLTALPGFTRGERCRPLELAVATIAALTTGVAALFGQTTIALASFLASVLLLLVAAARRVRKAPVPPPLEMMFVGFGLLLGFAGALVQLPIASGVDALAPFAGALGAAQAPPRFAERLVSLGMVLSLVLGVGGLLVPVFAGMREPLAIPGVARPHERRGRLWLYLTLIAAFAAAFVLELAGFAVVGALLRAVAASVIGLLVWKLGRLPGRPTLHAYALWASGWLVLAGLWMMALIPMFALGGLHLIFIGGFGLLTLAIATRVTVAHGHHPLVEEGGTLTPAVVALIGVAVLARLLAEWLPARAVVMLAVSGAAWIAAWVLWATKALPRIARVHAPQPPVIGVPPRAAGDSMR